MTTKNHNSKKRHKSQKGRESEKKLANLKKKKMKKGQSGGKEIDKKDRNVKKSSYSYSFKKYQKVSLRDKMLEKLKSSRFRYMNEQLYNMRGKDALKYFQSDKPQERVVYKRKSHHLSFKNSFETSIYTAQNLCSSNKNLVIRDFGCGDAKLVKSLLDIKVHSFNLVSLDPCVTDCDMASTPLGNGSLDVAVFCLSLIGTNFSEDVMEANRVLKNGGLLKIAEVESRFEDVEKFIHLMTRFGFSSISKNFSFCLFYFMDFKKERDLGKNFKEKAPPLYLKPCLYKKR